VAQGARVIVITRESSGPSISAAPHDEPPSRRACSLPPLSLPPPARRQHSPRPLSRADAFEEIGDAILHLLSHVQEECSEHGGEQEAEILLSRAVGLSLSLLSLYESRGCKWRAGVIGNIVNPNVET
jgi:hypothetical protein